MRGRADFRGIKARYWPFEAVCCVWCYTMCRDSIGDSWLESVRCALRCRWAA